MNGMEAITAMPWAEFGFPGSLRDKLVAAIVDGTKRSTTSLVVEYEFEQESLPCVGARQVVIDSAGEPVAVIETVAVETAALGSVPWSHVRDEGEGHASTTEWRAGHEVFWHSAEMRDYLEEPAFTVTDGTAVVLERFRVVELLHGGRPVA
ncbi:ASCH domain-containing protein [Arthrobacter sp. UYEF20]|uniref:ASCH domain-containing protein n=1 Tax=Arthrobacter sp. UYEF20 TaxID=1756363 RepID=UPI00339397EA